MYLIWQYTCNHPCRCVYKVAAIKQDPELCEFVHSHPTDLLFEQIPDHLLKHVVDELVPVPPPEEEIPKWQTYIPEQVRNLADAEISGFRMPFL